MNAISSGDTAWVLLSAALVLLMTAPGLAFFYGGMVRRKSVLSILMQCFIILCVISVQWVLWGYSIAFGPGNAFFGYLHWAFLNHVGQAPVDYAPTIPAQAFMIFQCMFAVITPALIVGAFAERMKFSGFLIFIILWATFIYDPIAHMVWGHGGFLGHLGALDFAGGTVVHLNAGIAGLIVALCIGKRNGYENKAMSIHNLPYVVLGASLLWFGWFGFNAGSALAANGLAANAFVTTNTATAMAAFTWAVIDWIVVGKPTMFGAATGAVAGLVAITPACGFVDLTGALFVGITVSIVCYFAVAVIKPKLGYDDSLDAFGVHGVGGAWGAIATGICATTAVNSGGANGLFHGNPHQVVIQLIAVGMTLLWSGIGTFIIYKVVDAIVGMRVTSEEEVVGLDLSQHHERAYTIVD